MANGNISIPPVQGRTPVTTQGTEVSQSLRAPEVSQLPEQTDEALRPDAYSPDQLRGIAQAFGDVVGIVNRGIRVEIDDSSNQVITQIVDRQTDEVIRQVPPEELLRVSQRLRELIGNILDEQG